MYLGFLMYFSYDSLTIPFGSDRSKQGEPDQMTKEQTNKMIE